MDTSRVDRAQAAPDPALARWMEGDVRFQPLVDPAEASHDVGLTAVFFAAGARTRPHIHTDEQVLYFVEGRGVVATESATVQTSAGDVVAVPAGTWHWHGATRDSASCHISIKRPGPTNWEVEEKNWARGAG